MTTFINVNQFAATKCYQSRLNISYVAIFSSLVNVHKFFFFFFLEFIAISQRFPKDYWIHFQPHCICIFVLYCEKSEELAWCVVLKSFQTKNVFLEQINVLARAYEFIKPYLAKLFEFILLRWVLTHSTLVWCLHSPFGACILIKFFVFHFIRILFFKEIVLCVWPFQLKSSMSFTWLFCDDNLKA